MQKIPRKKKKVEDEKKIRRIGRKTERNDHIDGTSLHWLFSIFEFNIVFCISLSRKVLEKPSNLGSSKRENSGENETREEEKDELSSGIAPKLGWARNSSSSNIYIDSFKSIHYYFIVLLFMSLVFISHIVLLFMSELYFVGTNTAIDTPIQCSMKI